MPKGRAAYAIELDAGARTTKRKKVPTGERMTKGPGWRLKATKGKKRVFIGTLLGTHNYGDVRIAEFAVPK